MLHIFQQANPNKIIITIKRAKKMISTPFKLVLSTSLIMLCVSACSNHSVTPSERTTQPQAGTVIYDHSHRIKANKQKFINQYQQTYIKTKSTKTKSTRARNTLKKSPRYQQVRNKKKSRTYTNKNRTKVTNSKRRIARVASYRPAAPLAPLNFKKVGYYNHQRSTGSYGNQKNTWSQIHNGFKFRNYNHKSKVRRYVKSYARMPNHMTKLSNRSAKYLPTILAEIQRRRMPTEIALLSFVESAFKTRAYSPAKAAGMWQFIPATARRYGLAVSSRYDARYNWKASTNAALDYLQDLNRQFHGDWLLSLAAYNCGEARVAREIRKNRARGRPTDFWSLNLPRETRNYVPRLLAFKEIYSNPQTYGVKMGYVPSLASAGSRQPSHRSYKKRAVIYRVKMGDTLYQIAKKHRTSVQKIMRLNGLKSTKIKLGKRLKISA